MSGKPHKTTVREDRLLVRQSRASPFSTAAELHNNWSPETPVSTTTVCRILSRSGLNGQISAQKPVLNRRQLKICQGPQLAGRMDYGKVAEGWFFFRWIIYWTASQSSQILPKTYWNPHGPKIHTENSQVWWRKNHGLRLHSVRGRARDLQSGWQHQQPEISRHSCCPLHSKPQERANSSAGWHSFSYFSLHVKVPES